MDERHALLRGWLQQTLGGGFTMAALTGDASFRRYFRVALQDRSLMAADVPPDKEDIRDFTRVTQKLEDAGVRAPHIHAADHANGWLLLDDFGDTTGLKALSPDNADVFYRRAINELVKVQQADSRGLPDYTHSLLVQEMCLFTDWYCDTHLQCGLTESQHALFGREFEQLAQAARAQPQVFVHRDYHSRNLMVLDAGAGAGANAGASTSANANANAGADANIHLGVLDYQDAVVGPVTYDLVSLLKDCYIVWPEARRRDWMRYYLERRPADADADTFTRWFDWMGIQRHLKAIGIFARLHHRDGKSGYLNDIPRILAYITESLERYPELNGLRRLMSQLPPPRTR
ncbi:MAG: phosphotransferase [Gammaproteobacteria bacterium]|nr:phosphotransferase [Gammaproteobacteria bacterium]